MISDFGLSKMEDSGVMATACGTPGTSLKPVHDKLEKKFETWSLILVLTSLKPIKLHPSLFSHINILIKFLTPQCTAPNKNCLGFNKVFKTKIIDYRKGWPRYYARSENFNLLQHCPRFYVHLGNVLTWFDRQAMLLQRCWPRSPTEKLWMSGV